MTEVTIASGGSKEKVEPMLARVSQNGNLNVPLIGDVQVDGLEPYEASERIASAAVERGIYRQPSVALDVTVVRGLLLPGAMSLLGRWNWWWPGARKAARAPAGRAASPTDGGGVRV